MGGREGGYTYIHVYTCDNTMTSWILLTAALIKKINEGGSEETYERAEWVTGWVSG